MPDHWSVGDGPVDDELRGAIGELAAWVEYLLNPEKYDGPAGTYTCEWCDLHWEVDEPNNAPLRDHACPGQGGRLVAGAELRKHSALDDVDPYHFFYAAHAFSGIRQTVEGGIQQAYEALATPYLFGDMDDGNKYPAATIPQQGEQYLIHHNLGLMRNGWVSQQTTIAALDYEQPLVWFALGHENCMCVLAETLAKYRAIYLRSRDQVLELMKKTTEAFNDKLNAAHDGNINFFPIAIAGIVTAVGTVVTGGTMAAFAGVVGTLGQTAVEMEGSDPVPAGKTWRELSRACFAGLDQIGDDAINAVSELSRGFHSRIAGILHEHGAEPPAVPGELHRPPY